MTAADPGHAAAVLLPRQARRVDSDALPARLLAQWADLPAYVLLGEPGSGKTKAFEREVAEGSGQLVRARALLNGELDHGQFDEPLFIDALDVVRAGSGSAMAAIDQVVQKLHALGRPQFRLACRAAEWFSSDARELAGASPDGRLVILQLEPMTDAQIDALLQQQGIQQGAEFRQWAQHQRIDTFLRQPLLLRLLVAARSRSDAPIHGRRELFARACADLLQEHDPDVSRAQRGAIPTEEQMQGQAGLLCAGLLLTGSDAVSRQALVRLDADPQGTLLLHGLAPPLDIAVLERVLASKFFVADENTAEPAHRSLAAYMAANALARRIHERPADLARILSWLQGEDGAVVEPLRELAAWLSTLSSAARAGLIECDPLGLLLYGDGTDLDLDDRRRLLAALRREAATFPHFRYVERGDNWFWPPTQPFGALGKADVAPELMAALTDSRRDPAHQAYLDCVLDAMCHGEPLPALAPALLDVVRDPSHQDGNRVTALSAWLRWVDPGSPAARALLGDLHTGAVTDPDDRLLGTLLTAAYPKAVQAVELARFFKLRPQHNHFGAYEWFWLDIVKSMPAGDIAALADGLVALDLPAADRRSDFAAQRRLVAIVHGALLAAGADAAPSRVAVWLGLLLDEHGYSTLDQDKPAQAVRQWLSLHPDVCAAVLCEAIAEVERSGPLTRRSQTQCFQLLHGCQLPPDWPMRVLSLAAHVRYEESAHLLFDDAAHELMRGHGQGGAGRTELKGWIAAHRSQWPAVDEWLQGVIDARQQFRSCARRGARENHRRTQRHIRQQRHSARHDRRRLLEGQPPSARFLHHICHAFRWQSSDEAPDGSMRLQRHLHLTPQEATAALGALRAALTRADLPCAADVTRDSLAGTFYVLRDACLAAADMAHADCPGSAHHGLTPAQAETLLAFVLDAGVQPVWLGPMLTAHIDMAERLLLTYLEPAARQRPDNFAAVLRAFVRQTHWNGVAARVVPRLLDSFSPRAAGERFFRVGPALMAAAAKHMPAEELKRFAARRLALPYGALSATQRMAWLLVATRSAPRQRLRELAALVEHHVGRRRRLMRMLDDQHADGIGVALSFPAAARLARLLLPHIDTRDETRTGLVVHDPARAVSRRLLHVLETADDVSADDEWASLLTDPRLAPWRETLGYHDQLRRRRRRNAQHQWPTSEHVMKALEGQARLNARDMATVFCAMLDQVERDLRDREGNRLEVFWHDPGAQRRRKPRDEITCLDRLLPCLESMLSPIGIALAPEVEHASRRRADMGLWFKDRAAAWRLPVEIKCENHREVWTAWEHQLADYARHPDADGCGVYLVLWFGVNPRSPGRGTRKPGTPQSMSQSLTARIPADLQHRLKVFVLDLSLPKAWHRGRQRAP